MGSDGEDGDVPTIIVIDDRDQQVISSVKLLGREHNVPIEPFTHPVDRVYQLNHK